MRRLKRQRRDTSHGSSPTLPDGERVAKALLKWFDKHKRNFSFRWTTDPYRVLVLEIMLRKTTARQVDKIWPRFIELFPTPQHLARASLEDIETVLAPLGLRQRARQLQEIARITVEEWGGRVPNNIEKLKRLPGVGDYIAGCVVSFCYNVKVPLIDSNVRRVLSRLIYNMVSDMRDSEANKLISKVYLEVAPYEESMRFHYALLDLASKLCRPEYPRCPQCPINVFCNYNKLKNKSLNSNRFEL